MYIKKCIWHALGWPPLLILYIFTNYTGKFRWKGTIKAVLKQAPDNEISVKKLRKKVCCSMLFTPRAKLPVTLNTLFCPCIFMCINSSCRLIPSQGSYL